MRRAAPLALALLLAPGLLAACGREAKVPAAGAAPERAFYFWRTRWQGRPVEERALAELGARRLYLRLFEVSWDDAARAPRPIAPLDLEAPLPAGVEIVPAVYLQNSVFLALPYAGVEALVDAVHAKVKAVAARHGVTWHELQIDCDWSDASRRGFFHFAELLRRRLAVERVALSATIRLHQVKYAERTGLPPVDRGMLMFYNFGRIEADAARSSIWNPRDAERYAAYIARYPLPLDLALPIFSWMVHSREGHPLGLIEKTSPSEAMATGAFRAAGTRQLEASRALFFRGRYFLEGDRLLVEETTPEDALAAARMAARGAAGKGFGRVALFDLDEYNLQRFAPAELARIWGEVR